LKIITVNIPESYIGAINKLIGPSGIYTGRSELVRVAVRDFLLRELKMAKDMAYYDRAEEEEEEDFDEENFIRVPVEKINEKSEPIREYKTYKILKRLEYGTSNSDYNEGLYDQTRITWGDDYTAEDKQFPSFEEVERAKPTIEQLRKMYPNLPDFMYINEGDNF